jgi:transcriptional regulator with XRE-family HTH domain
MTRPESQTFDVPTSVEPNAPVIAAHPSSAPIGEHLRQWRQRRRMSQLELAGEAQVSTRHLSFVETGRSQPSREMVMRLCDRLQIPLRDRNLLLAAAGFAAMYRERPLDNPDLEAARRAVDLVLKGHEPFPALALDRAWNMVAHNRAVAPFMLGVHASLLTPPVNVLRLSLHPLGLAPRIVNLGQWRTHILERLHRHLQAGPDPVLQALLAELRGYPAPDSPQGLQLPGELIGAVMPFRLATPQGELNFISTTTVFGTPMDVTLQELAIESFFPADDATARALRALA